VPKYLAWGTGSGTAQASDIALFNPVGSPVSGTVSVITTSTSGDTFLCSSSITVSGYCNITNVGLFDSNSSPAVGSLSNQVNPTDTTITLSGYAAFPNTFPFNIQVLDEVMTVTSGNNVNVFNVIRGANGSSIMTSIIPSLTPVVGPDGNLFMKSSFSSIGLQPGDSIQFNVSIQFI
jgi:cytochrome c oxidase assembly protein Cox11